MIQAAIAENRISADAEVLWQELARELADRLPFGVILADRHSRVLEMNRCARKLIAAGVGLTIREGRIGATEFGADAALQRAILRTFELGGLESRLDARVMVPVSSTRRVMQVMVTPPLRSPQRSDASDRAVVLYLFGCDGVAAEPAALMKLYGLTPAEAQVARRLVAGERVAKIGAATGTTLNTVRTHIRRIFTKSGCRSQVEFVHAVLTGPATLRGEPA